jgi:hypothetical protein
MGAWLVLFPALEVACVGNEAGAPDASPPAVDATPDSFASADAGGDSFAPADASVDAFSPDTLVARCVFGSGHFGNCPFGP